MSLWPSHLCQTRFGHWQAAVRNLLSAISRHKSDSIGHQSTCQGLLLRREPACSNLCHRHTSTSHQGAFFSHNHYGTDAPTSCFSNQLNMQWIQENKIWYFCLHSLKAAQGCKILQKTSLWFFFSWMIQNRFHPCCKMMLSDVKTIWFRGKKKTLKKGLYAPKLPTFSMYVN